MSCNELVIGSRGSKLALWQANHIKALLQQADPSLEVTVKVFKTKGDITLNLPLSKVGDKGLFIKELEVALNDGLIDLCVHSMKDVPSVCPEGLMLGPIPKRATANDVLVARKGITGFSDLPSGARIGTGSLRRRAQLASWEKNYESVEVRGNIDSRLKKVETGELDALILAAAGIERLGWEACMTEMIPVSLMIPAVGQGALALELRADDARTAEVIAPLHHFESDICVRAERKVMRALDGGCQVPIGAYAFTSRGEFTLMAMVATIDGARILKSEMTGTLSDADQITQRVIVDLIELGAEQVLKEARAQAAQEVVPVLS